MGGSTKLKVLGAGLVVAVIAGGGAALAATKPWSPHEESQAVINDAAKQLGVTPTQLSDALKKALENRIDDAVSSGLLTKAQGEELKKRIESADVPLPFGFRSHFGLGLGKRPFDSRFGFAAPADKLSSAASYLGLSESALASQLAQGKTLAQVAKDQGKSVDGLVDALVKDAQKRIDDAVASGKLTKSQGDELKSDLHARITRLVNGQLRFPRHLPFGPGFGPHFHRLLPMKPWSSSGFWAPRGASA